jgi:hypothetical protein
MSDSKKNLILISCIIFLLFQSYCFFKKKHFYPFSDYNMFSIAKEKPEYSNIYLYGINYSNQEVSLYTDKKFIFSPYNQRGFSNALIKTAQRIGFKNVLSLLLVKIHKITPEIKGLKLYSITCNCDQPNLNKIDISQYFDLNCRRKLLDEVLLEQ